jgi:hypothetical protein
MSTSAYESLIVLWPIAPQRMSTRSHFRMYKPWNRVQAFAMSLDGPQPCSTSHSCRLRSKSEPVHKPQGKRKAWKIIKLLEHAHNLSPRFGSVRSCFIGQRSHSALRTSESDETHMRVIRSQRPISLRSPRQARPASPSAPVPATLTCALLTPPRNGCCAIGLATPYQYHDPQQFPRFRNTIPRWLRCSSDMHQVGGRVGPGDRLRCFEVPKRFDDVGALIGLQGFGLCMQVRI